MTKKHYVMIAKVIKDNSQTMVDDILSQEGDTLTDWVHKDKLIQELCIIFKQDNNLFNSDTIRADFVSALLFVLVVCPSQ